MLMEQNMIQTMEQENPKGVLEIMRSLRHEINNPLAAIIANTQVLQLLMQDEGVLRRLSNIEQLAFRISEILQEA